MASKDGRRRTSGPTFWCRGHVWKQAGSARWFQWDRQTDRQTDRLKRLVMVGWGASWLLLRGCFHRIKYYCTSRAPANHSNESVKKQVEVADVSHRFSAAAALITPHGAQLYAYHPYTSVISSNVHVHNVSRCRLQSHLPVSDTTHTLADSAYVPFIIGNVTGEHLQRCHNLITVCKYDTAVGGILNTNAEEDFSCHICTLSDSVVPVCEIAMSTTICFYIFLRGTFYSGNVHTVGKGPQLKVLYFDKAVINFIVVVLA